MYKAYRNCPQCDSVIDHGSEKSQKQADSLRDNSIENKKLCRSCIATIVNDRRWSIQENRDKQSSRWKKSNPSTINGTWNKGIPCDINTINKIKSTIKENGGREGINNSNYGNFKEHNINDKFHKYSNRIRVLTERNRFFIPEYDETKRGKAGEKGKYQIDHIKSIIECWNEKLSVEFASDVSNLQFISWESNLEKRKWKKKNKNENDIHSNR